MAPSQPIQLPKTTNITINSNVEKDDESIFANLDEDNDEMDANGQNGQHNLNTGNDNIESTGGMQDTPEVKPKDKRKFVKKMSLQDLCSKIREIDFLNVDISSLPYANESKNNVTIKINNS